MYRTDPWLIGPFQNRIDDRLELGGELEDAAQSQDAGFGGAGADPQHAARAPTQMLSTGVPRIKTWEHSLKMGTGIPRDPPREGAVTTNKTPSALPALDWSTNSRLTRASDLLVFSSSGATLHAVLVPLHHVPFYRATERVSGCE